jgi:hypothetical protein
MVFVMRRDLVEFVLQRSNARFAVDELPVAICVMVQTSLIYDPSPDCIPVCFMRISNKRRLP